MTAKDETLMKNIEVTDTKRKVSYCHIIFTLTDKYIVIYSFY